ncbi:hypothetical protein AK812_SmicGene3477 [Symbiodinium microadriaticum]|uniref:Uncharacterized protein n=1 Tax=Symbiodinium microadriaticum TaxID=2951 RepID=A0A1Q9EYV1_SYMMI|nr:hypothetical protein AK812_SmicGene3477 [Symbiodinium microadriaticum]CAE7873787.1 unnamed protein product [Symbiodinium microadriaticum]
MSLLPYFSRCARAQLPRLVGVQLAAQPRAFGSSAQVLVATVEAAVASGRPIHQNGTLYEKISEEVDRLRSENDTVIAKVDELDSSRSKLIAGSANFIAEVRAGEDGSQMAETLHQIEELDRQTAELRSQQIQNYLDIGALKRQRVTIQKSEKVMEISSEVYEMIAKDEMIAEDAAVAVSLAETVSKLESEFDSFSQSIATAKKELENVVSRVRSLELSLRARRAKADHETDTLRANLISGLYEARRKNAQLTRYRIQQALNVKLVSVLERARQAFRTHTRIKELIVSGSREQMEVEVGDLLREMEVAVATAAELEEARAQHSKEVHEVTAKLRQHEEVVTPETGKLREQLIAALREEEFCMARLAVLRKSQAQDVKFLASLRKAIG